MRQSEGELIAQVFVTEGRESSFDRIGNRHEVRPDASLVQSLHELVRPDPRKQFPEIISGSGTLPGVAQQEVGIDIEEDRLAEPGHVGQAAGRHRCVVDRRDHRVVCGRDGHPGLRVDRSEALEAPDDLGRTLHEPVWNDPVELPDDAFFERGINVVADMHELGARARGEVPQASCFEHRFDLAGRPRFQQYSRVFVADPGPVDVGIDVEQNSAAEACLFPRMVRAVVILHQDDVIDGITPDESRRRRSLAHASTTPTRVLEWRRSPLVARSGR